MGFVYRALSGGPDGQSTMVGLATEQQSVGALEANKRASPRSTEDKGEGPVREKEKTLMRRKNFKKLVAAVGVASFAATAAVAPAPAQAQCQAAAVSNACNPCNPCAAKNPCNPCAAKNPCNPCAAANPCNPCAAKKACNPCNPCAAN